MRNLHQLEDSVLIDRLAEYTLQFTRLFRIYIGTHPSREYRNCKKKIERILAELEHRGMIPKKSSSVAEGDSSAIDGETLSLLSK